MSECHFPWGSICFKKANSSIEVELFKCDILNKRRIEFEAATQLQLCFGVHKKRSDR